MQPPYLTEHQEFTVVGHRARTTNAAESDPATARIPALWGAWFASSPSAAPVSVYTAYESDHLGAYDIIVGSTTEMGDDDATRVTVPAGRYLVFANDGPIPDAVIDAWRAVWSHFETRTDVRRAYTTDFERYDPSRPGHVEIHVAIASD